MVIRNYTILIAFLIISLIGIGLLPLLSVQLVPSYRGSLITVNYNWPGASPEAIEQQVTTRLEGTFSTMTGVKKIRSVSGYSRGYVNIEVDQSIDTDLARFELAALVRQVYPHLPHELSYPQISLSNTVEQDRSKPLLTLQLSGPVSPGTLQRYADEQLKPRLASVPDVGSVTVFGGNRPEWLLTYNADALTSYQMTEADIRLAIQHYFWREPLGQISQKGGQTMHVNLDNNFVIPSNCPVLRTGQFDGMTRNINWSAIPIVIRSGRVIYLNELIKATSHEPPARNFYRVNGKTAVNILLSAVTGANQLSVVKKLRQKIKLLQLPPGYRVDIEFDTTTYISENLRKIGIQTGIAILVLLLFVILTTRSIRYVILIISSMVVTLLLSVLVFIVMHVEIHLYSLAALTTSLGIVIDNIIVMIDHYRRYRDGRVFMALLGATLTTCVGLVVVWFLPEENRQALSDFALVMAITLSMSLLVSIGFVPAVMERFWVISEEKELVSQRKQTNQLKLKKKAAVLLRLHWVRIGEHLYMKLIAFLSRFRVIALILAVMLFGLPVFWLPNKLAETNPLASYYNLVLGSEWYVNNLLPLVNKLFGGTLRLFVNYVYEDDFKKDPERTALYIVAELPYQSTSEQMDAIFRRFEIELSQYGQIDKYITQINNGQEGSLVVYFRELYDQGVFPYQLKNRAIILSNQMSGVDWDIFGVGQGFSQKINEDESPTFNIELLGYNYRQLEEQAGVLAQMLNKQPRIQNVNLNHSPSLFQHKSLYEFNLQTKPQVMAMHGINATSLYDRIADYNSQPQPDLFAFIHDDYEAIKIIPTQSQTVDVWTLEHQTLQLGTTIVKLEEASKMVRQKIPPEIYKEDQQYRRVVSFEYFGSYDFGEKFINKTLNKLKPLLPLGYTAKGLNRNWFDNKEQTHYELIILVILLIYVICAIIFESFWQPLALIGIIPLSYTGVFLSFYLTESKFDQGGYASFLLLAGNVVYAGIFIVAEMNRLSSRFPGLSQLITFRKAIRHKVGPILLTVLSTVVGMVPFLLYEKEPFWNALGIGTIGGLLMSLVAVFVYLPLFLLRRVS